MKFLGAGISTESGLPDYRSEGVGLYAKKDHKVTQHQTFVKSLKARKSYWARNFVGWPRWSQVMPNEAHKTLGNITFLSISNQYRFFNQNQLLRFIYIIILLIYDPKLQHYGKENKKFII